MTVQRTPVRVVAVSSYGHMMGGLDLQDLHFRRRSYNGLKAYGQSKLCNLLFAKELARRHVTLHKHDCSMIMIAALRCSACSFHV